MLKAGGYGVSILVNGGRSENGIADRRMAVSIEPKNHHRKFYKDHEI